MDILTIQLNWTVPSAYELDASAFMLNSAGKVPNDEAMIFFNQPTSLDDALQYDANKRSFTVNLKFKEVKSSHSKNSVYFNHLRRRRAWAII